MKFWLMVDGWYMIHINLLLLGYQLMIWVPGDTNETSMKTKNMGKSLPEAMWSFMFMEQTCRNRPWD